MGGKPGKQNDHQPQDHDRGEDESHPDGGDLEGEEQIGCHILLVWKV